MEDLSKFLETHKSIAKIFPKAWFESELQKSQEQMHLLAKQFTFDDHPYDNAISHHLFGHLEDNLELLSGEIQKKRRILRELKKSEEYESINGQIEICSFFKKLRFDVELEPDIPRSKKISDIRISDGEFSAYIEVRTLFDREGDIIFQSTNSTISTISDHSLQILQDRIKQKSQQLSEHHPGIIALNLYNISRTSHIEAAFYAIARKCPIISGLFLYRHYFNSEGCRILMKYLGNPYANKQLPKSIERELEKNSVEIGTWTKENIEIIEKLDANQY